MIEIFDMAERKNFPSMARRMSKWVDDILGHGYHPYCSGDAWSPSLNVYEDDGHFHVVVDLAGMRPEDVDLHAEGGALLLSGERPVPDVPNVAGEVQLHLMEVDHGRFYRSLDLPANVDTDKIEATYSRGFLWIRLPKKH